MLPGQQHSSQQTSTFDDLHSAAYCSGIEFQLLFAGVHLSSNVFLVALQCCC
jgi:hypothetical protein